MGKEVGQERMRVGLLPVMYFASSRSQIRPKIIHVLLVVLGKDLIRSLSGKLALETSGGRQISW